MERYEIAIIGTGPAGLSAAITATIRNKKILLIGNQFLSEKVEKAHTINNYLGLPNVTGKELQEAFLQHLKELDITITETKVNTIYALGEYFVIDCGDNTYEATSVILATGLSVAKPFKGELENIGKGVSYCATCDAQFYKNKVAAVVGFSQEEESEAVFLSEIADKVLYFPMYKKDGSLGNNIVICEEKPQSIEKEEQKICLITEQSKYSVDGIFLLRDSVAVQQLVPGLKLVGNLVEVDRQMQTNLKGLFACGDITGAPYQYIKSAGEGNVAALSAVSYLNKKK